MFCRLNSSWSLSIALAATLLVVGPVGRAEPPPAVVAGESTTPEEAIQRALARPIELDFTETSLCEVVSQLESKLGVQVRLDRKALDDIGIEGDRPVTFRVSGISARSALDLMLKQLDVTWVIRDEVLSITTPEEAQQILLTKVYDFADLVCSGEEDARDWQYEGGAVGYDYDALIDVITSCIQPTTWDEAGGPGSIGPFEAAGIKALVLSQTREVHEEVQQLLADLRAVRQKACHKEDTAKPEEGAKRPLNGAAATAAGDAKAKSWEQAMRDALRKPVTLELVEAPLLEVTKYLKDKTGIQILIDRKSLADVGVGADTPVTIQVADVSLQSALDMMLREPDLTCVPYREVLWITTPEEAEGTLTRTIYDVSDLPAYRSAKGQGIPDYDSLIELITTSIQPVEWDDAGGPGSIAPYEAAGLHVLVVIQTSRVHEQVKALLADLRKVRGPWSPERDLQKLPEAPPSPPGYSRSVYPRPQGSTSPMEQPAPLAPDPKRDAVVQGNNRFAFNLYARLRDAPGQTGRNMFFSPCSISTALAMVYSGARGQTAQEMADVLNFTLPQEELHPAFRSLRLALAEANRGGCQLSVANRLWGQEGYEFLEAFRTTIRDNYGAELAQVDFHQPETAGQLINTWTAAQTNQRIRELIDPGKLTDDIRLVLTNAVYFKGTWLSTFDQRDTRPGWFYTDGKRTRVQMMHRQDYCRYAATDTLQILEKPYAGSDLSMIILLPKRRPEALADLEASLNIGNLQQWTSRLSPQKVDVYLPKFEVEMGFELKDTLAAMGMSQVFDPFAADLSGMAGGKELLWLFSVFHKAFVRVDEEGTEATAATGASGMGGMAMEPPPIPVFRADHPFVFLIRDGRAGSILFLGRLVEPAILQYTAPRARTGMS